MTDDQQRITFAHTGFDPTPAFGSRQHHFAMASLDFDVGAAGIIAADLRAAGPQCDGKLDLEALTRDERGRAAIAHALGRMEGHFLVTTDDKRRHLANIFFRTVLETVFEPWCDQDFIDEVQRIVEPALVARMAAVGSSSDALSVEIDSFIQTLDARASPTLFGDCKTADPGVLPNILRFVLNHHERLVDLVEPSSTSVTSFLPLRAAYTAAERHARCWLARDFTCEARFENARPLNDLGLLYDDMGEWASIRQAVTSDLEIDAAFKKSPIEFATTENAAVLLAKIVARAAALVANQPDDGALTAIANAIARHTLQSSVDERQGSVATCPPDSAEAADAFRRLVGVFVRQAGWGDGWAHRRAK